VKNPELIPLRVLNNPNIEIGLHTYVLVKHPFKFTKASQISVSTNLLRDIFIALALSESTKSTKSDKDKSLRTG
jgi:hypothetical protein